MSDRIIEINTIVDATGTTEDNVFDAIFDVVHDAVSPGCREHFDSCHVCQDRDAAEDELNRDDSLSLKDLERLSAELPTCDQKPVCRVLMQSSITKSEVEWEEEAEAWILHRDLKRCGMLDFVKDMVAAHDEARKEPRVF